MRYFLIPLLIFLCNGSYGQNTSLKNSDVIALGLPLYAASVSYLKGDEKGLIQLGGSEALTLILAESLKLTTNRTRPDGSDNQSFPSAHTGVSFAAAQYLYKKGGWEYGLPAYALAGYVGYARVDAKKHYWSDVIAGGLIGSLSAQSLTDTSIGNRLSLYVYPGAVGVLWQTPIK